MDTIYPLDSKGVRTILKGFQLSFVIHSHAFRKTAAKAVITKSDVLLTTCVGKYSGWSGKPKFTTKI